VVSGLTRVISANFFYPAEDGIRDRDVTGVQTLALPISQRTCTLSTPDRQRPGRRKADGGGLAAAWAALHLAESCALIRAKAHSGWIRARPDPGGWLSRQPQPARCSLHHRSGGGWLGCRESKCPHCSHTHSESGAAFRSRRKVAAKYPGSGPPELGGGGRRCPRLRHSWLRRW